MLPRHRDRVLIWFASSPRRKGLHVTITFTFRARSTSPRNLHRFAHVIMRSSSRTSNSTCPPTHSELPQVRPRAIVPTPTCYQCTIPQNSITTDKPRAATSLSKNSPTSPTPFSAVFPTGSQIHLSSPKPTKSHF